MKQQNLNLATLEVAGQTESGWLFRLPGPAALADRLGPAELRRRLLHMIPGVVPIGLPFTPHSDVWEPVLFAAACVFAFSGLVCAIVLKPYVIRHHEEDWTHAVIGYILPVFGALLLLPGRSELALLTLQIVAFGDGSATLGGKLFGGRTLPWNPRKTFSGLFCFVVAGSLAATYSYWGEARPAVSLGTVYFICCVAALCAGIAESLPVRLNDNFRVGVTALVAGIAMSAWMS